MSGVGFWELMLVFMIGLIVLGPERLPRVAQQVGTWLGQARRMTRMMKRQLEEELNLEKELDLRPRPTPLPRTEPLVVSTQKTMTVAVDGQVLELESSLPTVREALMEVGLVLNEGDQIDVDLDAAVEEGLAIEVTRAKTVAGTVVETMKFGEKEVKDPSRAKGTRIVQQQGRVGERQVTYTATVVDGKEIDRQILASVIVTEPLDRVVLVGTMEVLDAPPVKPGTAGRHEQGRRHHAPRAGQGGPRMAPDGRLRPRDRP